MSDRAWHSVERTDNRDPWFVITNLSLPPYRVRLTFEVSGRPEYSGIGHSSVHVCTPQKGWEWPYTFCFRGRGDRRIRPRDTMGRTRRTSPLTYYCSSGWVSPWLCLMSRRESRHEGPRTPPESLPTRNLKTSGTTGPMREGQSFRLGLNRSLQNGKNPRRGSTTWSGMNNWSTTVHRGPPLNTRKHRLLPTYLIGMTCTRMLTIETPCTSSVTLGWTLYSDHLLKGESKFCRWTHNKKKNLSK